MQTFFIVLSSALALTSPVVYIRSILKGESKPHRTTRLILLLITTLTTASLIAAGDTVAVYLAGVSTIQSVLIFALSIKHGMGGWAKSDIVCLVIALIGIVMWQTTKNPLYGLYFAILADFTGMVPALIKTWKLPETETWLFYGLDVLASICILIALNAWTLQEYAYPIYIMIINIVMAGIILIRPKYISMQTVN